MSDAEKRDLLEMLGITWVHTDRATVSHLLPAVHRMGKLLIRERDQFRVIEPGMVGYYQPAEILG